MPGQLHSTNPLLFLPPMIRLFLFVLVLALGISPAGAAVEISFYSREWANTFPHAFITLKGADGRTGERIDASYGFTATHVSPAVLFGSVKGEIVASKADYIARSDEHFRFTLTDAEYDAVLATVERWRNLEQPSYHLNRQNCVFFVAHIGASIGMTAETPKALMKKPRSYTESLTRANRDWLDARGATVSRPQLDPAETRLGSTSVRRTSSFATPSLNRARLATD